MRYLDLVGSTPSGRTLFRFCNRYSGRRIEIIPFKPTPTNPVNAGTVTLKAKDIFTAGQPVRNVAGTPVSPPVTGTGVGADATIEYHPANQRQFVANKGAILSGSGPGEALFHELVHAMRMVHGVFLATAAPANPKMGNFEDFCSVAASNLYRSERGFKIMRDSHRGYDALEKSLTDPDLYYDYYKSEFATWFRTQRVFCLALANSPAPFNPFKVAAIDLKLMAAPAPSMRL